jgi:hypothetical protein
MRTCATLLAVVVIGIGTFAVSAGATTNPKRTGTGGTITCLDSGSEYSDWVVGPPLESFAVANPCDTWMYLYFARRTGIVHVMYVPPGTPSVTVSIDALRAEGLANMQYDSSGSGGGSIYDTGPCNANLVGIPSDVVERDGSLQPISC